jgi:hypothetical protein
MIDQAEDVIKTDLRRAETVDTTVYDNNWLLLLDLALQSLGLLSEAIQVEIGPLLSRGCVGEEEEERKKARERRRLKGEAWCKSGRRAKKEERRKEGRSEKGRRKSGETERQV